MAYTTSADVRKYFLGITSVDTEGNDTLIPDDDIDQFIDEQTAIIDLVIGKKYILPITNVDDLLYLKLVNDKFVVCQLDKQMRTYATDDEGEFIRRRNFCKEAQDMLNKIMNGEIPLNAEQKSFRAFSYNKTTVYDDDCKCRIEEVKCDE